MLREFIYVDADKVRSLLAQLDGGIAEELKVTEKNQGNLSGGIKNIASREQAWGTEESTQRSLADAVFPTLEDALTTEGYLSEVSAELLDLPEDDFAEFQRRYPPGSFVRITGSARLFDARYVARAFEGVSTAASGAVSLQPQENPRTQRPRPSAGRSKATAHSGSEPGLESLIPDYSEQVTALLGGMTAEQFRAFVKVARGLFYPGLHLAMSPSDTCESLTVTARLQESRRFLDSEPDVLFARYGVLAQDWTLVGTVGSYSTDRGFEYEPKDFAGSDGVKRAAFVATLNDLLMLLGNIGFADHPQYPGFSVVPFAVYRPILPRSSELAVPTIDGAVV